MAGGGGRAPSDSGILLDSEYEDYALCGQRSILRCGRDASGEMQLRCERRAGGAFGIHVVHLAGFSPFHSASAMSPPTPLELQSEAPPLQPGLRTLAALLRAMTAYLRDSASLVAPPYIKPY